MSITYTIEDNLDPAEFTGVLRRSGLAERRPADQPDRIAAMVANADLMVCARDGAGMLVGVARSMTDFSYCCSLSDIAVDAAFQHQGIGKELIHRTHRAAGEQCTVLLLSAPAAMDYYPKVGMKKMETCFAIPRAR